MAYADVDAVQLAVWNALTAALTGESLVVLDHPAPEDVPRYVRIDGFSLDDVSLKNRERAWHAFVVHYFDRNTDGSAKRGNSEAQRIMKILHAAIMADRPLGRPVRFVASDIDSDEQGGASQHAWNRYRVQI